ncbi:hypothetical protein AGMMS50249_3130 [candidate division SR1 bacterium]|nr:hypothetical protein AGMMS50249_3130 [candidate division SR1 bacterium]
MTFGELLKNPKFKKKSVLEALIKEYTNQKREEIWLHLDDQIDSDVLIKILKGYGEYVDEKKPLEYILGHVDFFGYQFYVNQYTIIPRPETEYMIEAIDNFVKEQKKTDFDDFFILLDIGTGSGILGISSLLQNPDNFKVAFLSDISQEALDVAKINYNKLIEIDRYDISFLRSDLAAFVDDYPIIRQGRVILVANLPYIPDDTFDNNALENVQKWEPRLAFVGGDDGLNLYRIMFDQVKTYKNIIMFLEMMTWQVEILRQEFGDWMEFEEVKTFHFNIRIVKCWVK